MASLYFLIPLSLLFVAGAVALFVWAVNSGQYDDMDREAERILYDDDLDREAGEERDRSCREETGREGDGDERR